MSWLIDRAVVFVWFSLFKHSAFQALPALYSLAGIPQLRNEANIFAETIQATLGAERIWQLADVNNKSQILAKFLDRR